MVDELVPAPADVGLLLEEHDALVGLLDRDREDSVPVAVGDGRAVVRRAVPASLLPLSENETPVDHREVGRRLELEAVPDVGAGGEMEAGRLG